MVQAFALLGYRCWSGLTATKCSLAFQRLMNEKHSVWPCTIVKAIVDHFDSYLATSLTKFDMRFCRVDLRVEVDG